MSAVSENELAAPLDGKRVAFVGKLGGMARRQAQQLVRQQGAIAVEKGSLKKAGVEVDIIVIGADELPLGERS